MALLAQRRIEARRLAVAAAALGLLAIPPLFAAASGGGTPAVPDWLFPMNEAAASNSRPYDNVRALHVPNASAAFTEAELNNLFSAPDWHPASHGAMPGVVAHGHPPEGYACGYCHTAGGQGRPENAALAGLPKSYILSQVADFKNGARRSACRERYGPTERMIHAVTQASDEELSAAAEYFAAQTLQPRVVVLERASVPASHVVGWVYAAANSGGVEPLGQRLLEFAPDVLRHENRDDEMRYVAYVPLGSIGRGRRIAHAGVDSPATACVSCHGPQLHGVGSIPPIAGRSPTYILRQLFAFQTGARSGASGLPMRTVAKSLQIGGMIDVAAYAASLPPYPSKRRDAQTVDAK